MTKQKKYSIFDNPPIKINSVEDKVCPKCMSGVIIPVGKNKFTCYSCNHVFEIQKQFN